MPKGTSKGHTSARLIQRDPAGPAVTNATEKQVHGMIQNSISKQFTAKGMAYAAEAGYKAGDIDFSSQVARMKAADVDLIVIATVTRETIGIMAEVKKLGWNTVKVITGNPGREFVVAGADRPTFRIHLDHVGYQIARVDCGDDRLRHRVDG